MADGDAAKVWWSIGAVVAVAAVATLVLTLASGDESAKVYVTVPVPTTAAAQPAGPIVQSSTTVRVPASAATTEAGDTPPSADTAAPTSSAPAADATVPETSGILVAGPGGIQRLAGSRATTLSNGSAAIAVERAGTVYFQGAAGRYGEDGSSNDPATTAIRRLDGTALVAPEGEQWLTLHDAGVTADGTPVLIYTASSGDGPPVEDNPTPSSEVLYRYEITTGTSVRIAEVGGWEFGTGPLSFGTELVGGTWSAEASYGPLLLALDGTTLAEAGRYGLEDGYTDCEDCPTAFSVDGPGGRIAWIDSGRFRVATRSDGVITLDFPVVADTSYTATALADGFAVLSRPNLPALLLDLTSGAVTELPAGRVTIIR